MAQELWKQKNKFKKNHDISSKQLYNKTIKIATINIKGMKRLGLREMVEYLMMENEIDILAIQETQTNINKKEARKHHTWYFSGEKSLKLSDQNPKTKDLPKSNHIWAGVAIVVKNELNNYSKL